MVMVYSVGPAGGNLHGLTPSKLCLWLLASLALAASVVSGAWPADEGAADPGFPFRRREHDGDEQCLCGIATYALLYSKVFGRNACSSSGSINASVRVALELPLAASGTVPLTGGSLQHPSQQDSAAQASTDPRRASSNSAGTSTTGRPVPAGEAAASPAPSGNMPPLQSCSRGHTQKTSTNRLDSEQAVAAAAAAEEAVRSRIDAGGASGDGAGGRLIVRFDHYAPAADHRALLRRVLGPEGPESWSWLPRSNPAAAFPTDFALLAAAPAAAADVRQRLAAAATAAGGGVRDVHLDRRYTGKLSWVPEGQLRDVVLDLSGGGGVANAGGGTGGSAAGDGPDEVVFSVSSRRPGRIVTRFSTEQLEGEDDPAGLVEAHAEWAWRGEGLEAYPGAGQGVDMESSAGALAREGSGAGQWAAGKPQLRSEGEVEQEEEEKEEGSNGGLTGSRRRVASAAAAGQDLLGSGMGLVAEEDTSTAAASAAGAGMDGAEGHGHGHSHGHRHGHGGDHAHLHSFQHQHRHHEGYHPLHRRKRHRDHFMGGGANLDGAAGGGGDDSHALHGAAADGATGAATASAASGLEGASAEASAGSTQASAGPFSAGAAAEAEVAAGGGSPHLGRSLGVGPSLGGELEGEGEGRWRRRLQLELQASSGTVPVMLQADKLWKQGYTGKGVKVGIFDTGIRRDHPHLRNIRERTNWTHQDSLSDGLGHGSFVAGVVGGQDSQCPGFAPDVDLYTFKVFTDDQVSYTSWFLDAFNYAMIVQVNVINLSIGGPDYLDQPFVDKVLEVTSSGIMMVSAIGNDGPLYGTLNNPADQNDVIGVGGIDNWDNIASFSSRGMSTWELPRGYGRVKPDVMAYAKDVQGSKIEGGCRSLSGTSVASPVVTGAVCLLASTVPEEHRWEVLNPASMKQALVEGAVRLNNLNIYEQGNGRINLPNSMAILQSYKPRASVIPAKLDLTDCPYMWPFCRQHLYTGALPVMFNATLLNGQGVVGWLEGPPVWRPSDPGGELLHLAFEWSDRLWPWSGFLALYIRVRAAGVEYDGLANGVVECVVVSPPAPGEATMRRSTVTLPVKARIGPTPPRSRRVLWDQFHSLKYPPAYLPRDNLDVKSDILDWHGDHPHTNFHGLYNALRDKGYFLEVLGSPATCFDPTQYGALLIVDSEEEFYPEEVAALEAAVAQLGLNLIVFAEWYNLASLDQMRFFDDNTRSWWDPATGGANVPALNDLLAPFGMALGDSVIHGTANLAGMRLVVSFGSDIAKVPEGGWLHKASLNNAVRRGGSNSGQHGYLGGVAHGSAGGHVVVFADSNCLDRSHMSHNCYELVLRLLARLLDNQQGQGVLDDSVKLSKPYVTSLYNFTLPERRPASEFNFTEVSYVLRHPQPQCFPNAACEKQPAEPSCRALLAADNETRIRQASTAAAAAVAAAAAAAATGGAARTGKITAAAAGDGSGDSRRGSGTVLLVHPDGTSSQGSPLPLGLSGLQLLALGCALLMGLFLAVWVMRLGVVRSGGLPGGGSVGGGAGGGVGGGTVAMTGARRDRLSSVRLRGTDV